MYKEMETFNYDNDLYIQEDNNIKKEENDKVNTDKNTKIYNPMQSLIVVQMIFCGIILLAIILLRTISENSFNNLKKWYDEKINDSLVVSNSFNDYKQVLSNAIKSYSDTGVYIKDYHNHLTTKTLSPVPVSLTTSLSSPISKDGIITSKFGNRKDPITGEEKFHKGIDISADDTTQIYPVISGIVSDVNENSSYGKYIIIDHGNNIKSLYAHCSDVIVKKGDSVSVDAPIAHVGNTGHSTGNHLHLELLVDGQNLDPEPLISDVSA